MVPIFGPPCIYRRARDRRTEEETDRRTDRSVVVNKTALSVAALVKTRLSLFLKNFSNRNVDRFQYKVDSESQNNNDQREGVKT